jgi:hypothetical protein
MAVVLESMQLVAVSTRFLVEEGQNLHSAVDLGQVTVGNHLWWLIADTDLETSWAPIHELDGTLCLESSNS